MTERELEQRLRDWFQAEFGDGLEAPTELRAIVAGIPDTMPTPVTVFGGRRNLALLAAAAMLAALLVGGALAVGSGLIRLPWLPDESLNQLSTEVLGGTPCDLTLEGGVLLSVEVGSHGSSPPSRFLLYDSGLLIRGPLIDDLGGHPWQQRRLSTQGVTLLLEAVKDSGLRDCQNVPAPGPQLKIKARTGGAVIAMNLASWGIRVAAQAELAAAAILADRLVDPDLGVPSGQWNDRDWQPFAHDRWEIRTSRWEGLLPSQQAWGGIHYQQWADMVLPDGSTFMTMGSTVPVGPEHQAVEHRCRVVTTDEREGWIDFLGDPVEVSQNMWAFQDGIRGGGVLVRLSPLLPHRAGCEALSRTPMAPEPYVPDQSPDALGDNLSPRGNLIEDLRACDYLPENEWPRPYEYTDFGGGWAACESMGGGWLFASRHPISSAEALTVVQNQFGVGGFTTDEIAGRTVYLNNCLEPASVCSLAIAVSAEPHFFIIVSGDGSETTMRLLAEAMIERIDR